MVTTIIRTRREQTIVITHDTNLPRPYSRNIVLQGTKGVVRKYPEQRIHIEGRIWKEEEITLGQYMENIGLAFDAIHLIDKENGDGCQDGKENKVRLVANGEDTPALDRYVIRDGDTLLLSYE